MFDDDEEEEEKEEIEAEPQVTSSDPNERKLARQMRIKRRLEALRKRGASIGTVVEVVVKSAPQQQMIKSAKTLEKLIQEADEVVTNVRVANDTREADRRELEGIGREKIIQQLEEEAQKAIEDFDEINEKWREILKYDDPLNMNDAMVSQKEKCDELIKQKDEIIAMLKNEIREAELKFNKDQKKQNEDIRTLTNRIEKHVLLMQKAYSRELQLVEDAILAERKLLTDANMRKWEELYKKRSELEETNCARKFEQLEEFEKTIKRLCTEFQEKYREVKIKLENDSEKLEVELEKIKALSLLNNEKLDYNYQILRKREDENMIIKSQQKRRINKLQDVINELRKKIRDYERDSKEQIEKLSHAVRKLHGDIQKIEAKADHFQVHNDMKFHQVWEMNKAEAEKILERITTTDRVIFQQVLGVRWKSAEQNKIDKADLPSYKSAMHVISELCRQQIEFGVPKKTSLRFPARQGRGEGNDDVMVDVINIGRSEDADDQMHSARRDETLAYNKLVRHIMKRIGDKAGLFIEKQLRDILEPYSETNRELIRLDNVFAAIGIKKKEDIAKMVEFFLPYSYCPVCSGTLETSFHEEGSRRSLDIDASGLAHQMSVHHKSIELRDMSEIMRAVQQPEKILSEIITHMGNDGSLESLPSDEIELDLGVEDLTKPSFSVVRINATAEKILDKPSGTSTPRIKCNQHHPLLINSVYVMKALREFVCSFYSDREGMPSVQSILNNRRHTVSRLMLPEDIEGFWQKYSSSFTMSREKLWDGLFVGLKKYHAILHDRKKTLDEVKDLRKENDELKKLLFAYMSRSKPKNAAPCSKQRDMPLKSPISDDCRRP